MTFRITYTVKEILPFAQNFLICHLTFVLFHFFALNIERCCNIIGHRVFYHTFYRVYISPKENNDTGDVAMTIDMVK